MVKFTPRIVSSGLVATVVLGGLVSAENCSVAAVPTSMPLGNQTTVRDSWKRRTQSLAQSWFKVKTPQQSKRELAEYTEAIRLNPKNADAYLKRGNLRSGLLTDKSVQDKRGAIADYTEAIRLEPKNARAYQGRADTRLLNDDRGAIADYTEVIRLEPQNASAYSGRGLAREQIKDIQGAIADYTETIRLNPKETHVYSSRARLNRQLGNYQAELADQTEMIRIDEDSNPTGNLSKNLRVSALSNTYAFRGETRKDLGDYQGALADYQEAIRLDPDDRITYAWRAEIFIIQGNFQDALRDANRAIDLGSNPKGINIFSKDNPHSFLARGAARTGLGDYQGAQQDFDRTLKLSQKYDDEFKAKLFYWQGFLRLKQGKPQQAIAEYEKAIQGWPAMAKSKAYKDYSLIARGQLNTPVASQSAPLTAAPKPQPTNTAAIDLPKPAVVPSPPNVYKIAKATTLLIEGQASGSGVIISKVGNTYFVLTAKHVVQSQQEYTVTTPSGKKYPLDYKQIKKLANLDLAVAQFTSEENLSIAQLGNSEAVDQGDVIYVSGWPAEDKAITKRSQFASKGEIAGVQSGNADGYELMYGNSTGPGMSGGPIFNSNGQVVGIHGRAAGNEDIGKVGINLGIPVHLFLRQAPQAGLNLDRLGLRAKK
jgi:tetratricopeptide (TPR) repeat protein